MIIRLAWRELTDRWSRYVLMGVAVALGVAFVGGALTLAASVHTSYGRLVQQLGSTVDVYVRGPESDNHRGISDFAPVPESLRRRVATVSGASAAEGQLARLGQLVTPAGSFIGTGSPTYAYSWLPDPAMLPYTLTAGRAPSAPGEVVIDAASARTAHLRVGDAVRVSIDVVTPQNARVVGLVHPRGSQSLAGATAVFVDATWGQHLVGIGGGWDLIEVRAARGTAPETLRDRIRAVLPDDGTSAVTGKEFAAAEVTNLARRAGSVTTVLLAIGGFALVVGIGIVINTLRIILRQRARELALLRMVGAGNGQVTLLVLIEATTVGLVAAITGAVLGVPAASALRALALASTTVSLPPLHVVPAVVVAAAAGGTVATALAALAPARMAVRTLPVAAWREATVPEPPRELRLRSPAGAALTVAAALGTALAIEGVGGVDAIGGTGASEGILIAAGVLLGGAIVAALPFAVAPALRALRAGADHAGAAAAVATAACRRDARRVAAPAAALALGLGLVTAIAIMGTSASASIGGLVRRADRADLVATSDAAPGIDPEAVEAVRGAPTVAAVTEMGADSFEVNGRADQFTALDTDTAAESLSLPIVAGTFDGFADGDVAVTRSAASAHRLRVGDYVQTRFGIPQRRYLAVTAIIADNGVTRDWIVPFETYRRGDVSAPIRTLFIDAVPGSDPGRLRRQVDGGVTGFPGVSVYDARGYAASVARRAEGPIDLIEVLVSLACVVAVLGVADALSLSVVERGAELALLRSLGMTRRDLAACVRWEAAFVAGLGAVAGVAAGLLAGYLLAHAVGIRGLTRVAIPARVIGLLTSAAVAAAVAAASIPARRAARGGVLIALHRL